MSVEELRFTRDHLLVGLGVQLVGRREQHLFKGVKVDPRSLGGRPDNQLIVVPVLRPLSHEAIGEEFVLRLLVAGRPLQLWVYGKLVAKLVSHYLIVLVKVEASLPRDVGSQAWHHAYLRQLVIYFMHVDRPAVHLLSMCECQLDIGSVAPKHHMSVLA